MKKLALLGLATIATGAYAGVNLNLSDHVKSVVQPGTGFVDVVFSGTVDVLPNWDATSAVLYTPDNGSAALSGGLTTAFLDYLSGSFAGTDFNGDLFFIRVQASDAVGFYDQNALSTGGSSELVVNAVNGNRRFADNEYYGVEVQAVPEPATLAALGLGAIALIRRRRK